MNVFKVIHFVVCKNGILSQKVVTIHLAYIMKAINILQT